MGGQTERENKEIDIWIEGAIIGLARNLALRNSHESTQMTPDKTLSNYEHGA